MENEIKTPSKMIDSKVTLSSTSKSDKTSEKKPRRREAPKPIVDAGDMFDIHSYDYLEEEFGTISSITRSVDSYADKPADDHKSNENFNFVEECQTLRERIRAGNQSDSDESVNQFVRETAVGISDIQNMMASRSPIHDGSIDVSVSSDSPAELDEFSNRSTIGSSHNTTEIAELEDVIKDLNINEKMVDKSFSTVYLASGAQESCVVVWNTQTGAISDRIELKSQGKSKIPSKI